MSLPQRITISIEPYTPVQGHGGFLLNPLGGDDVLLTFHLSRNTVDPSLTMKKNGSSLQRCNLVEALAFIIVSFQFMSG